MSASRFPLIPGRDCAAVVEAVGGNVHNLAPGDEVKSEKLQNSKVIILQVMAVVPVIQPGTHAEYVVTESALCSKKPEKLSFEDAAALPYVASTAFSALSVARVNQKNAKCKDLKN